MKVHASSYGLPRQEGGESQDAFAVRSWDQTVIAVIADGVGGARAGQEAATRAVETLLRDYAERPPSWSPSRSLTEFTRLLNQRLYQDSLSRFGVPEIVSTMSVAVVEGDRLYGLNVGDSRVYLARGGELRQLSSDHVLNDRTFRHVLSRALGLGPEIEPHLFEADLVDGDVALLCTDGVSNVLTEQALQARLDTHCTARVIVADAQERAAAEDRDDMSAIVVEIAETGKVARMSAALLAIPERLEKGLEIEGFTLVKPFQQSDRVWLATQGGQRFTLKFAPVEARTNEAVLQAFSKETWHATRLQTPYFPRTFVPEACATRCYVMEFIEAPSLKALLRSRRLSVDEAIALGVFLLGAGQDLLKRDLVHGDCKPENVLVLRSYDAIDFRLVDFGSVAELFSTTTRAGTASYLAPERFHAAPISERTEVYAIGVTLYEALTGAYPYGEVERYQTPRFHAATDPCRLNPNIPPWLGAVLQRATAARPEQRYASYSELLYKLRHPELVEPFCGAGAPLLERDPLLFYQIGFWALAALCAGLLLHLLAGSAH